MPLIFRSLGRGGSSSGGGGDVTGPPSAVDDRISTFNGPTGKDIQDGGQTIAEVIAAAVAAAVAQSRAKNVSIVSSAASIGVDAAVYQKVRVTALAVTTTFTNPANPADTLEMWYEIYSAAAQTLNWDTAFVQAVVPLPLLSYASGVPLNVGFAYTTGLGWVCIAAA